MGKLEKSEQHPNHQANNVKQPRINSKLFNIKQSAYPDRDDDIGTQHYDSKSEVDRRRPAETINTFHTVDAPIQEQSEKYCKKLHRNRKQTGSICGGL